jgi:DNA mismatch repair protein MutH
MNYSLPAQLILNKAQELEGLTFLQLSRMLNLQIPHDLKFAKGWLGQAVETFLGAKEGCLPIPDFPQLQIELKTLPLNQNGQVIESTYVTTLPLMGNIHLHWEESPCYHKLKRVLWIPIEGDKHIAYHERRIGKAILWEPNESQLITLKSDWELITDLVIQGKIEKIHGGIGEYLHIRPKAANSKAVTKALNEQGELIHTLPRGFYLRAQLTQEMLNSYNPTSSGGHA